MEDKFNYSIAFNWPDTEHLGFYVRGTGHWYGTMEDARDTLRLVQAANRKSVIKYFICKVVPLEE